MLTLRIKLKPGDLQPFAESIETVIGEHLDTIHYLDFYNLRWLIMKLRQKSIDLKIYDPFRPGVNKAINIKIDINVGHTYSKIFSLPSIIWENPYLSALNDDVLGQIDRQVQNLKRVI